MKFEFVNKTDKGSALVIAAVVVLILAFLGIALIQLGRNARMQVVRSVSAFSARAAADAGLAHAMRFMTNSWNGATDKPAWLAGWKDATGATEGAAFGPVSFSDTFGGATFSYAINKGTKANGYKITSTGTAAGKTRIIHAAIVLKSAFKGIGGKDKIDIFPGATLGTIPDGDTFILQTNSTDVSAITLKPGLTIPGDVVCGPGGDPCSVINTAANTTIEGIHSASEDYIEFPPVYVPAGLLALPFGTPAIDPCDSTIAYIYADMKLDELQFGIGPLTGVETIYIQGNPGVNSGEVNIFVDGFTYLTPISKLIVTKDSSMTLYLGGNLDVKSGCDIIYGDTPHVTDAEIIEAASSTSIKGTVAPDGTPLCTDINFRPGSDFYGTIYAPDADPLYIAPNGAFYGAIIGSNNITLKPGGDFMFIPSLTDIGDEEVLYVGLKQGSWWEE